MTRAEAGKEWLVCAACGASVWCYSAERLPGPAKFNGRRLRRGAIVHTSHRSLLDTRVKARLSQLRKGGAS